MNIKVEIPPGMEQTLQRRAHEAGMDVAQFVSQLVKERMDEPDLNDSSPDPTHDSDDFESRMREWIERHPDLDQVADDSRESIYPVQQ